MLTETLEKTVSNNGDSGVPKKHLTRYSERRFDGTVETLCGLIRTPRPAKASSEKCEKCLEIEEAISYLNRM